MFSQQSILNKMREFCSQVLEDQVANANPNVPIILGDFTNW